VMREGGGRRSVMREGGGKCDEGGRKEGKCDEGGKCEEKGKRVGRTHKCFMKPLEILQTSRMIEMWMHTKLGCLLKQNACK